MTAYRSRGFPGTLSVASSIDVTAASGLKLAGTAVDSTASELNKLDESLVTTTDAPWACVTRWAKVNYDFATEGGTVAGSPITLPGVTLPDNAILIGAYIEVITAVTSGGSATVSVGVTGSAAAILAATGKASWTTGAILPGLAVMAAPIKLTGTKSVTATVATADLTAGNFNVWIEYLIGDA